MGESSTCRARVLMGDITTLDVDAVVNAANSALVPGGGVDGAIHAAAGPGLKEECAGLGGCPVGEARVTGAYRLPARWVIHTVGPVWRGGSFGEPELLEACYGNSLAAAERIGARSVAFPAVSTGAYGYPLREAARVACRVVVGHLSTGRLPDDVILVCYYDRAYRVFSGEMEKAYNT